MPKTPDALVFLGLLASATALYKQWIPDTNFENATNWDKGAVPCGNDRVQFAAQRKVSVYVETTHSVLEMRLPVDGELILASGAGFAAVKDGHDPGCGDGVTAEFRDSEPLQWFDPALWQAATASDNLEHGPFLFSVHEESVPCQYDDVVFRTGSSFRVDTSSSRPSVTVRSVSVLGKKFGSNSDFTQYKASHSGRLQFHGSASLGVGAPACGDISGCDCGNSGERDRICANVKCSPLDCEKPLRPAGHCCDICGAIVTVRFATCFNLESYRQQLQQRFLTLPLYKTVQLAMSKVLEATRLLGVIPFGTTPEIQVALLDQRTGHEAGTLAEALAGDILKDIANHGAYLCIEGADFQGSSAVTGSSVGMVVGAVLGTLAVVAVAVLLGFLFSRGVVKVPQMPSMPSLGGWKKRGEIGNLGGAMDLCFDNPMFEKPTMMPEVPGLYGTESMSSITMTHSGVHFVNPAYDENETDFSA